MVFIPGTSLLTSHGGLQRSLAVHDTRAKSAKPFARLMPSDKRTIWGCTASPDGRWLVVVDTKYGFHVWEVDDLNAEPCTTHVELSQADCRLIGESITKPPVGFWTADDAWRVYCSATPYDSQGGIANRCVLQLEFRPESRTVIVAGRVTPGLTPLACRYDETTGVAALRLHVDPQGRRVIQHLRSDDGLLSKSQMRTLIDISGSDVVHHGALDPRGRRAAVLLGSGLAVGSRAGEFTTIPGYLGTETPPLFLPDASLLTEEPDGSVAHWQTDPLKKIVEWEWEAGPITALAASDDGALLAAAGDKIVVWDRE